jgi:membrane protein implicated in regulation of membrane protease activity
MDWLELVFLGSAVIGGTLFLLRMLTLIVGGLDFGDSDIPHDFDGGLDADLGADFHGDISDVSDVGHASAVLSFKFLSLQGLTAFFMMFGLIGLAILRADMWPLLAIGGGTLAGALTVWVMGVLFAALSKLQSDGTIDIKNAVGKQGTVYLRIPAEGSGQVSVAVQGSLKIFDAVSEGKKKIPTGEKIKVINVIDNKTLVVTKI